jgi:hypothetical protein
MIPKDRRGAMADKQTMPELPEYFLCNRENMKWEFLERNIPMWLDCSPEAVFILVRDGRFRAFITAVLGWLARDLAGAWAIGDFAKYESVSEAIVEWREFEKAVEEASNA